MEFLQIVVLSNTIQRWLLALLLALLIVAGFELAQRLLIKRLRGLTARTVTDLDDLLIGILQRTQRWIVLLLAFYPGMTLLEIPAGVVNWGGAIAFALFLVQVGVWGNVLIEHWLLRDVDAQDETSVAERATTLNAVGFVARLLLISVLLLLALDNLPGVEVTALIASLGIGGVAVALAVQNILGDLFASLSIALDKPFVIGDFIIVGDLMGTVDHIGLKTTRLRSLWGEELVFANSDLLDSRIRNYKRMEERRVAFTIGVTYDTTPAQLRRIPVMAEQLIVGLEQTRFDRAHFKSFGDFALTFEIVYYVLSADYNVYMDLQQAINLGLLEQFAAAGIQFAYPTQTLLVQRLGRGEGAHANGADAVGEGVG